MTVKTPWHLWVVGVLGLLWNGFGAFDFISTTTRGEAYFRESGFDQPMIDYFNAMPSWMYVPWTLGVWGAVIGTILLLVRLIYGKFIDTPPPPPPGMEMMQWMPFVILAIAAFLLWYAWSMARKGVLR
jgi:hypothetical protein